MSKQRKLRSKLSFDDDEDADNPPPPPPPASKKDGSKPKKSSLLSFGDDDESHVAPSKSKKDKAKVSKFHRANISATAAVEPSASQRPASGEYTAERLAALQAATQKLPSKYKPPPAAPSLASTATAAAAAAADGAPAHPAGVIKLSGSFKQAAKPKDDRFSYSYSITGHINSSKDAAAVPASKTAAAVPAATAAAAAEQDAPDAMPLPPPPRPGSAAAAGAGRKEKTSGPAAAAAAGDGSGSDADGSDEDADGFMPDKETIRLAKAKRERLRQAHLAPDYVPLGGTARLLGTASAQGLGRLGGSRALGPQAGSGLGEQEEDQGLGDELGPGLGSGSDREGSAEGSDAEQDLEERMRMTFVGQPQQQQQQQQQRDGGSRSSKRGSSSRKAAAAAIAGGHYATTVQDIEDDDHSDHEQQVFDAAAVAGPEGQQQQRLASAIRRNASGKKASWLAGSAAGPTGGLTDRSAAVKAAGGNVMAALLEAASRAVGRHKHLEQNLQRTTDNLTGALDEVERVRADIAATSEKYTAVQSFKAYLADLADCLADKAPLVEELQDSLDQTREEAAAALRQQQQDDEHILFAQAEAAVTAALAVLGRGGAAPAAAAAADNAAAEAEDAAVTAAAGSNGSRSEPEVDEFGRDMSLMRRKELAKGKDRRSRCVAALLDELQALKQGGQMSVEDAFLQPAVPGQQIGNDISSSSSSTAAAAAAEPEAVQQYSRRRQEILDLIPTVFADADEQYASLPAVKSRLERFKSQYSKEYNTAYIGESAAALFAPYVRLELLQWEPLPFTSSGGSSGASQQANGQQQQQQVAGFDTQDWYQALFEYGLSAGAGSDDADANLVPQLVESLVLPMALLLVARCWDPHSVAQSRAVAALVSELFVYVPADKEDMAQLLALTTGTLESAAAATTVPPWPSAAAAASPIAQAMLQLRFKRAAALLQGLLGFKELLSQQLMFKLALQGLVAQQLVPCLRSTISDLGLAVARAEAVVQALPSVWFSDGSLPREAQSLVDVLVSLGRSVEVQQQRLRDGSTAGDGGGGGVAAPALAGYAKRLAVLLVHVGMKEQAQRLGQLI